MALKLEDIDFDNQEQIQSSLSQVVEVPVGMLKVLLESYYTGGGEPNSLQERLSEAEAFSTNRAISEASRSKH